MNASADEPSAEQPPVPVGVGLPITLGQFLKLAGLASTGGEAKRLIISGHVTVNGQAEFRRGRHLGFDDVVATHKGHPVMVAVPTPTTGRRERAPRPLDSDDTKSGKAPK